MKRNHVLSVLLLTPLLLSSCGEFKGNTPGLRNGDILYLNVDNPNYYRDSSFKMIDTLIESKQEYILMFTREGCSACNEFKPVLDKYIKESKQLVYRYDISSSDFTTEFIPKYCDSFFPNKEVLTPTIFVSDGENISKLDNNRFKTKPMFKVMMRKTLYETNVYSFTRFAPLKSFMDENKESTIYLLDRNVTKAVNSYNEIKENLYKSESKSIVVEMSFMNETNLNQVKSYFNIDVVTDLITINHS